MSFTEAQREAFERDQRRQEAVRESFVRKLMDFFGMWRECENRACRRARGCQAPGVCGKTHAEAIREFQREEIVPYLRERYPTVEWGAPASVVHEQYEAAVEAEREAEARRQGRAPAAPSDSVSESNEREKKKNKRVPVHRLYDPEDI